MIPLILVGAAFAAPAVGTAIAIAAAGTTAADSHARQLKEEAVASTAKTAWAAAQKDQAQERPASVGLVAEEMDSGVRVWVMPAERAALRDAINSEDVAEATRLFAMVLRAQPQRRQAMGKAA